MRLLSTFLKRKLENGRVESVHVEYVKRTVNMQGVFEKTVCASYSLPFTLLFTFSLCFLWEGVGDGGGGGGILDFD